MKKKIMILISTSHINLILWGLIFGGVICLKLKICVYLHSCITYSFLVRRQSGFEIVFAYLKKTLLFGRSILCLLYYAQRKFFVANEQILRNRPPWFRMKNQYHLIIIKLFAICCELWYMLQFMFIIGLHLHVLMHYNKNNFLQH